MSKTSYRPYVYLLLFFFCIMSLPYGASQKLRSLTVASCAPGWRSLNFLKNKTCYLMTLPFREELSPDTERLSQENLQLHSQIESVREWLLDEERLQEQIRRYQYFSQKEGDFFKRRAAELCQSLKLQLSSLPAKVIFREPATWSSSLWINLGEKDNQRLKMLLVCKNSPVVVGTSVVGVVEYVGHFQSRVRLITDASLTISVRAVRGELQNRHLLEHLDVLLYSPLDEETERTLQKLKRTLSQHSADFYLAKGELKGSSTPLWRSRSLTLKGIGFNCDFADAEGPARDLRSGERYGSSTQDHPLRLLQKGDLLVTTGLDGIFPPGFQVATVSCIKTLKEGASSYEIEALPTAINLNSLSHLVVLAPCES